MSATMSTGQQLPAANSMGDMSSLPTEVLLMICEYLMPSDRSYTGNKDVITVSQLNRHLNAIARRLLFRDITLCFRLTNGLPSQLQAWRPQAWEVPEIVRLLQGSEALRKCVKSVRLRLYPFPLQTWTRESFKSIRARLKVNTNDWGSAGSTPLEFMDRHLLESNPRSLEARQNYVIGGYGAMYVQWCGWPDTTPWTQDLELLLQRLLSQLPGLEHAETADAESSPWLALRLPMRQWSISYADILILRTAPPSVQSIGFESWPPSPVSTDGQKARQLSSHASSAQRLQDFIGQGVQFLQLTIDIPSITPFTARFYSPTHQRVLDDWELGLRQLRHLTTLTLSQEPESEARLPDTVRWLRGLGAAGLLAPKLSYLLGGALVVENVKTLTLGHWITPATLLAQKIRSALPGLERLRLCGIIMLPDSHVEGDQGWNQFLKDFERGSEISVAAEELKWCIRCTFQRCKIGTQACAAFQQRLQ